VELPFTEFFHIVGNGVTKMRLKILLLLSLCLFLLALVSCSGGYEKEYQFTYTFNEDQEDWITGFADLPADFDPALHLAEHGQGPHTQYLRQTRGQ